MKRRQTTEDCLDIFSVLSIPIFLPLCSYFVGYDFAYIINVYLSDFVCTTHRWNFVVPKISKAFTKTNRVENTEDTDKNSKDYIGKCTRNLKQPNKTLKSIHWTIWKFKTFYNSDRHLYFLGSASPSKGNGVVRYLSSYVEIRRAPSLAEIKDFVLNESYF